MQAASENRVLTIRQEPTATRADFGTVGYNEEKKRHVSHFSQITRWLLWRSRDRDQV